ncbi:hypothetical protein J0895_16255 [Phormidium pseudopriestleyi FRX01]|uniref:Uncharacterized protein n=1 Tax=Phormidium pseudopriestleyi FRX01 TaxID=1759528 RepID=A0ABS3FUF3_9CYAN|nr:hypothetical protein [Phormidium pseudopriestleyi]MBO0350619.1 hypothetical protein [Phormidium pseudopriestleyi FRX01]
MVSSKLLEIARDIRNLSVSEQQWLLDKLVKQIQSKTQVFSQFNDSKLLKFQLQEMAQHPEVQAEIAAINEEFAIAELDGL